MNPNTFPHPASNSSAGSSRPATTTAAAPHSPPTPVDARDGSRRRDMAQAHADSGTPGRDGGGRRLDRSCGCEGHNTARTAPINHLGHGDAPGGPSCGHSQRQSNESDNERGTDDEWCQSQGASAMSSEERERRIRAAYARMSRASNLSEEEKTRRIQAMFFNAAYERKKKEMAGRRVKRCAGEVQCEKSYCDEEKGVLGCQHYPRKCKLVAKCCGQYVTCRFCHDENADHAIDRFATEDVVCMTCSEQQPVAESCRKCSEKFARYFCAICKFYDDTPGKKMYHCDECGFCRVGEGLGIDNFHCGKCNACVSLDSKDRHRCFANALQADCPICAEFLFTSTESAVFMRCGHTMHERCFKQYTEQQRNYTCPLCAKSLVDMSRYFRQLDYVVARERQIMPREFQTMVSHILCNDCGAKSTAPFHFAHHKCSKCFSYNTRVVATQRPTPAGPRPVAAHSS